MMKAEAVTRSWDTGVFQSLYELTKPRITTLVVMTTAAGFYLAAGGVVDWPLLVHTLLGTALVAGGTAVLNQYLERDIDGLMSRTARRPLPSGRLNAAVALWFGLFLSVAGTAYLLLTVNALTAILGAVTCIVYLVAYTPLKTRSAFCTTVGAVPGAFPPMMGWSAVRGTLDLEAWILFGILFLWQYPHFLSIAWIYREDYRRGGLKMLPQVDTEGKRTAVQVTLFTALLLIWSWLAFAAGLAGLIYLAGATLLGAYFLRSSLLLARHRTRPSARHLLRTSVLYLPLLLILMMLDRV